MQPIKKFYSNTYVASFKEVYTHGQGRAPDHVKVYFRNLTPEYGFQVGWIIDMSASSSQYSDNDTNHWGMQIQYPTTNTIELKIGDAGVRAIRTEPNFGNGYVTLSSNRWDMYVYAWWW